MDSLKRPSELGQGPDAKRKQLDAEDDGQTPVYSSLAQRMMARMGHQEGEGLGRTAQGIVDPIAASKHMGTRGLGFSLPGLDREDIDWEIEQVDIHEEIDWLEACLDPLPAIEELMTWPKEGPEKLEIEDETVFCDGDILGQVLASKSVFDQLEGDEFLKARTRSNPFETIKGGIFLNRAAMKMANIDRVSEFLFTYPRKPNGEHLVGKHDLLYFADICAAPGGFSEYVLWRRAENMAKGFGFTLKSGAGVNDFKLDDFFSGHVEFFEPHYGVGGADGDGDIMRCDNMEAFQKFVLESSDGQGVHFVMGDGGFSVKNQENIQEILTKQLLLCQFCMALSILRTGGNFVCKTFDLFTPFSVGLIYLLWRAFHRVAIFKPLTSRPANSERYVVCKGLREGGRVVFDYLFEINKMLSVRHKTKVDVNEVVPLDILLAEESFSSYMKESNETLGKKQIYALRKLRAFIQNPNLTQPDQAQIRKNCLAEWKVPDDVRAAHERKNPKDKIPELHADQDVSQFFKYVAGEALSPSMLKSNVEYSEDWRCSICCGRRLLILGQGRYNLYATSKEKRWMKLPELARLELPRDTLIEAELVEECRGEGKGQRRTPAVYIVDALIICGKDLRQFHYKERMRYAEKLVKAVSKPTTRPRDVAIRMNSSVRLAQLGELLNSLCLRKLKGRSEPRLAYRHNPSNTEFVCPEGLILFRHLKEPWHQVYSRSRDRYYFDCRGRPSTFDFPQDAAAGYRACVESRLAWLWDREDACLHRELCDSSGDDVVWQDASSAPLSRPLLLAYVRKLSAR